MSDLLRRGDSALRMAQDAIKNYNFDDMFVNDICMLLEQAFERYLKGYLELNGYKYPKVHEIDVLLETIKKYGLSVPNIDALLENSGLYNKWAVGIRYGGDYHISLTKVNEAVNYCTQLKEYVHTAETEVAYTKEQIEWCRENAPKSIANLPDDQLWEIMSSTYYKLKSLT